VRRRVFLIVLLLTLLFLGLFWLVNHFVFGELNEFGVPEDVNVDARTFAGAFLTGLAMFATLFLGIVLSVFLTLGVVSGDAERGLLQPLVVRPVGRTTLLLARFLGAAGVAVLYVLAVFFSAVTITKLSGDWTPDRMLPAALELAAAAVVVVALSSLGSVFLSAIANGIMIFMLFGAGLVAGLVASIGHALNSDQTERAATIAAYALPFQGLYQDALRQITITESGLTGFLLQLGPFGGAYVTGWGIRLFAVAYVVAVLAAACGAFSRKNL
jgi:ABC-type transport system involved in multi-copper enzyme maturation permease subunit